MALTQDLPISNSMYKLLNLIIDARQQFPKAFRYEFGTELMMLAVHCCEYIRYANTDMNLEHRADYLMKFLCEFRVVGTSENGEELVTFASSEYPEKPTLQQIQRSIDRYRVCLTMYGDTISDEIEKVDLSVYMFTD